MLQAVSQRETLHWRTHASALDVLVVPVLASRHHLQEYWHVSGSMCIWPHYQTGNDWESGCRLMPYP